ncbi:MAG: alanine racemase [Thermovirgaceae bacterium]|nr:alanine racemase [Thermovirgaceae bacterium]
MAWRPTRMEVNLDNLRYNYRLIREHVKGARVIAVIKANAYSLGLMQAAWALRGAGADFFAVAIPDEAIELRDGGITSPVLVLGTSPYSVAGEYVRLGIRAALTDPAMARALSAEAVRQGKKAFVHVKIDTGLGRIGFIPGSSIGDVEALASLPGIEMEGAFTHFATADIGDMTYTREQYGRFLSALDELSKKGIRFKIRHCCNSAATLEVPEMALDAVRPGHILVGMYPSPEVKRSIIVKPCFEFKTAIGLIRELPEGTGISYGLSYTTKGTERIAQLPIGYADGYFRELWDKGAEVLVGGVRCPVVGRICMDQMMVNVSAVPNAVVGDEVVLIGKQGEGEIPLDEIADRMGTITCVPPTLISRRVPRVYIDRESENIEDSTRVS